MAGGGEELGPGEDGVEEDVADTQQGGSYASGRGNFPTIEKKSKVFYTNYDFSDPFIQLY